MCRPDGRHVLNNQGTDDYVLTLEAAGITCEVPQTQDNGSDVTIRPQFGPALVPSNTASGKIIQMPQRKII